MTKGAFGLGRIELSIDARAMALCALPVAPDETAIAIRALSSAGHASLYHRKTRLTLNSPHAVVDSDSKQVISSREVL
jgi:hypothetical protein